VELHAVGSHELSEIVDLCRVGEVGDQHSHHEWRYSTYEISRLIRAQAIL
jgi:hypothetical protein